MKQTDVLNKEVQILQVLNQLCLDIQVIIIIAVFVVVVAADTGAVNP